MFTDDKITEIFCLADDFCKYFDYQVRSKNIRYQIRLHPSENITESQQCPKQKLC